jgi:membrane associated rhomboid family serine protease
MRLLKQLTPVVTLVALCWLVYAVNNLVWGGHLSQYGIIPRRLGSLPGIMWGPFLHASFHHLVANTVPLLILGGLICLQSSSEFVMITVAGTLLTGGLTWIFARNASHIGASGLIFCFFGYLASMAYFRRTLGTLILSVVCLLAYGGIVKGILPTSTPVSWESHIAGLASGIILAWLSTKMNPTQEDNDLQVRRFDLTETLKK